MAFTHHLLPTRGAIVEAPPPDNVLEIPKSVPEKFGARSTALGQ
jgi:hypothetical protein